MSVSNSSIDPSVIFVAAEKPQVLKTTDTHFGTFRRAFRPIGTSIGTLAVRDHTTSPVHLSPSCLEPALPDQPPFRRPRLCRRLQFVIRPTTGLVVKLAEFALTIFVDMVWPRVTSAVSTSRSYIQCVIFLFESTHSLNYALQSPFSRHLGGPQIRRPGRFLFATRVPRALKTRI